ncbi:lytic transglycosylase domain-containing protein [Massilia sp. DWR3-1-1]|uniref:lytic transglycosylase domain-containing protein n=1 Tax=Massilia sp. DWR3-1-1 TaxID=2804559 RepID=UPI003CFAF1AE
MLEFLALAQECAPTVAPQTMAAVVNVESGYKPFAIGVVGGRLARQPANKEEAVATAIALADAGWNFSMGVAQVNRHNLPKYNISYAQAFDACTSLRVGSKILEECYVRAAKGPRDSQAALQAAISCYYSGNFTRGFRPDEAGKPSYVQKVLASAGAPAAAIPVVPLLKAGAAVAAPKAVKTGAAVPADHSPVLVRRETFRARLSDDPGDNVVRVKPMVTDGTVDRAGPVTKNDKTESGAPATLEKAVGHRSVIVF